VETEKEYIISRVNTHDADKLQYFEKLGLRPGTCINLTHRAPFNGPLHIKLGGEMLHLGHELAGVLRVCSEKEFDAV
jgi:DtxR family Mn-dependent transcriptional regulator